MYCQVLSAHNIAFQLKSFVYPTSEENNISNDLTCDYLAMYILAREQNKIEKQDVMSFLEKGVTLNDPSFKPIKVVLDQFRKTNPVDTFKAYIEPRGSKRSAIHRTTLVLDAFIKHKLKAVSESKNLCLKRLKVESVLVKQTLLFEFPNFNNGIDRLDFFICRNEIAYHYLLVNGEKLFQVPEPEKMGTFIKTMINPLFQVMDIAEIAFENFGEGPGTEVLETEFWAGGRWKQAPQNSYVYGQIEKKLELFLNIYLSQLAGNLTILELFAGTGDLAEKITRKHKKGLTYLLSDLDSECTKIASDRLSHRQNVKVLESFDAVNGNYQTLLGNREVSIVVISGGLTSQVLANSTQALTCLKKVDKFLKDDGILILSGLGTSWVGEESLKKIFGYGVECTFIPKDRIHLFVAEKVKSTEPGFLHGHLDLYRYLQAKPPVENRIAALSKDYDLSEVHTVDVTETDVTEEEIEEIKKLPSVDEIILSRSEERS